MIEIGVATYPPAWHAFVEYHPADCICRVPAVDPWPGAPVPAPRPLRLPPRMGGAR